MSTLAVNAVTDANGGNTATINSMTPTADSLQGFRNRIINGDCRIAQRGTAAVTTSGDYPVDRFLNGNASDATITLQQSTTAPAGFINSILATVTSPDASIGATQFYFINQNIEGTNVSDLGWGTANAKTITLSFWVRSSLTGTYGGVILNQDNSRAYPFSYVINSANTFEYKTITIVGDTTGTWLTNTSSGVKVVWSLGCGSTYLGTAGSWAGGSLILGATGQTQWISTSGATFYITGVQFEVGSVATPFERRPYGMELILCQRYLPAWRFDEDNPEYGFSGQAGSATGGLVVLPFLVQARTRPTGIVVSNATHFQMLNAAQTSGLEASAVTFNRSSKYSVMVGVTCATGLVAGNMSFFSSKNTSAVIYATGCEL